MATSEGHEGVILVADDNEANRELLSALLSAEGYTAVCVADGRQAVATGPGGYSDVDALSARSGAGALFFCAW